MEQHQVQPENMNNRQCNKNHSLGFGCGSNRIAWFIMVRQTTDFQCHLARLLQSYLMWRGIMALWAYFPIEVQVQHLKHFGTSQCHPTCQDCGAFKPQGTNRGRMEFPVKIKNQQETCYRGGSRSCGGTSTSLPRYAESIRVISLR